MAEHLEPLGQQFDLRGFAAPFGAFKRDETALIHFRLGNGD
jgi:hypothetical protein